MISAADTLIRYLERTGKRPIVVASHPRSGTHLLIDALRLNARECAIAKWPWERLDRLYIDLDRIEKLTPQDVLAVARRSARPLIKTHATGDFTAAPFTDAACPYPKDLTAWLQKYATFLYSYRDGRESLVSTQHLMTSWDPAARRPFSDFIRQQIHGVSRAAFWARHVESWLDRSTTYCVTMEGLLYSPERVLGGIGERLGLRPASGTWRLPPRPATRFGQRLSRVFHRSPSSTAIICAPMAKSWRALFSADDRLFFARETSNLLILAGHEESADWIEPALDGQPTFPIGFWNEAPRHAPQPNAAVHRRPVRLAI